jgi:hypothetical protein
VDERSDVYSLGAVGYAMLAGREPFAELSADEVVRHRIAHDPPRLDAVSPSVPKELAAIVMRCLERDPARRWPTARALREALARAGGDLTVVPEALRELPTFGPYALIWAMFWFGLAARPFRSIGDRAFLALIALIVPAGFLLQLWNVFGEGMSRRELARIAFWPPEWWGMWWPRSLRRPTDLWTRLPWPARAVRALLSAFIVALPAMILLREWIEAASGVPVAVVQRAFERAELVLSLGAAAGVAGAIAWAVRRTSSLPDAMRVLFGATMPGHGWGTPRVARLLVPRSVAGTPEGDSPAAYARAIAELAGHLPALDARSRAEALSGARGLLGAIERCDAEIARLSSDASDGELDRLAARIAALEAEPAAGPERPELLALLRRELELMRHMRVQCEAVAQRRAHLCSRLRGLWQRVAAAGGKAR